MESILDSNAQLGMVCHLKSFWNVAYGSKIEAFGKSFMSSKELQAMHNKLFCHGLIKKKDINIDTVIVEQTLC